MGAPKKPVNKPNTKPADDSEDDDMLDDDHQTKSKFADDDDDDDFDLPLDDVAGFDEIGFDDDDDF